MGNLAILASVLPQIAQAVIMAEQLFPAPKSGESKLAYVLERAQALIDGAPALVDQAKAITGAVRPFVEGFLDFLHDTGLFTHSDPTAAPSSASTPAGAATGAATGTGAGTVSTGSAPGHSGAEGNTRPSFSG